MATVAAIFDDSVALERAVSRLNDAGLGDDIVQVSENRDADTAPEASEVPGDPDRDDLGTGLPGVGIPAVAGAGGVSGGGSGGQNLAPLLGGFAGRGTGLDRLDRLGDDAEPFRLAAERGGKLIMLETSNVETAVATLQGAGAQQIYDPR